MKYIRTKNGMLFPTNAQEKDIPEDDCFFKVGETIEELCDGYYIDDLNYKGLNGDGIYLEFGEFRDDFMVLLYEDKADIAGYGFIKTDKGLIYVAKMNEEGEFELL